MSRNFVMSPMKQQGKRARIPTGKSAAAEILLRSVYGQKIDNQRGFCSALTSNLSTHERINITPTGEYHVDIVTFSYKLVSCDKLPIPGGRGPVNPGL